MKKLVPVFLMIACVNLHALNVAGFTTEDGTGRFNFGPFEIRNAEFENNTLIMPLERDEYKNITLLTRDFYNKLAQCFDKCSYAPAGEIKFEVTDAAAVGKIFLATVTFDKEMSVTFVVSDAKGRFYVRRPSDFIFTDKLFEKNVKEKIREAVSESRKQTK
ncbi:MAG: hypothetical protein LBI01_05555 [Elusimicrobium sp.]|jgi:hypothetical protein|nr:hypothetical protein [Elusimicrobium sp.]